MRGLAIAFCASATLLAQTRTISDAEVMKVHRDALLIDTHNDVPMKTWKSFDIGKPSASGDTDLPRLKAGGVNAVFFAAYVPGSYVKGNRSAHHALEAIDSIRNGIVRRYPNDFHFAVSADDILAAQKLGKIAALIGIEGGHAIEDSLLLLRAFYDLGVRYMTLTHSNTNNWADSSGDINRAGVKHHDGLTSFGREVVLEMNRIGMIIDVSHVADKTFWDAVKLSKAPVFASHSSCRALTNHPRNMTDEMIKAMAQKGGVIQINFACAFIKEGWAGQNKELKAQIAARHGSDMDALRKETNANFKPAELSDVVAHIDHVVKIAGIEAVGIGSDFDGIACAPSGLDDVSKFPNLTRALLEKGYSPEDIRKIYGGNTLRVMRAVEKAASR